MMRTRRIAVFSGAACCTSTVRAVHPFQAGAGAGRSASAFDPGTPAAQAALQLDTAHTVTAQPRDDEIIRRVFFLPRQTVELRKQNDGTGSKERENLWQKYVLSQLNDNEERKSRFKTPQEQDNLPFSSRPDEADVVYCTYYDSLAWNEFLRNANSFTDVSKVRSLPLQMPIGIPQAAPKNSKESNMQFSQEEHREDVGCVRKNNVGKLIQIPFEDIVEIGRYVQEKPKSGLGKMPVHLYLKTEGAMHFPKGKEAAKHTPLDVLHLPNSGFTNPVEFYFVVKHQQTKGQAATHVRNHVRKWNLKDSAPRRWSMKVENRKPVLRFATASSEAPAEGPPALTADVNTGAKEAKTAINNKDSRIRRVIADATERVAALFRTPPTGKGDNTGNSKQESTGVRARVSKIVAAAAHKVSEIFENSKATEDGGTSLPALAGALEKLKRLAVSAWEGVNSWTVEGTLPKLSLVRKTLEADSDSTEQKNGNLSGETGGEEVIHDLPAV